LTSALFVGFSILLAAGILFASSDIYFDLDSHKIIVNEAQKILKNLELTSGLKISGTATTTNILPFADNFYTLGSSNYRWKNIYSVTTTIGNDSEKVVITKNKILSSKALTISTSSTLPQIFLSVAGNVGIGTTSPASLVEMVNTKSGRDYLRISQASSGDIFIIDKNRNIGIGTTTPGAKLSVVGNAFLKGDFRFIGDRTIQGSGSLTINPASNLYLQTDTTYIDNSGNVILPGGNYVQAEKIQFSGNITIDANSSTGVSTVTIENSDGSQVANLQVEGDIQVIGGKITLASGETIDAETTDQITINSDGLTIIKSGTQEILRISAQGIKVIGQATTTNTLYIASGGAQITGDVNINSGNFILSGSATINQNLTVSGHTNLATTTLSKKLTITSGGATITGPLTLTGNANFIGDFNLSGSFSQTNGLVSIATTTITGNLTVNATTIQLTGNTTLSGNLIPSQANTYNLGSSSYAWNNLYVNTLYSTSTTVLGNQTINGNLTVKGNTILGDNSADIITFQASNLQLPNNLNIDSNTLFIDATNNRIGIGTTTPLVALQIGAGTPTMPTSSYSDSLYVAGDLEIGRNIYTGSLNFPEDAGIISWVNLPISDSVATGTVESYSAQIDDVSVLTIYGEADGSGGVMNTRVGIGTTSPSYLLTVDAGSTSTVAVAANGKIIASGDITANTSLDLAERYPIPELCFSTTSSQEKEELCPEAGEIVMLKKPEKENKKEKFEVIKASSLPDVKILGVVSERPGFVLGGGYNEKNSVVVALAGRVPVKVSLYNGPIHIGDPLTLSTSTPGVAVKLIEPGEAVGWALEDLTEKDFEDCDNSKIVDCEKKIAKILMFVQPGFSLGSLALGGEMENLAKATSTQENVSENSSAFVRAVKRVLEKLGMILQKGVAKVSKLFAKDIEIGTKEKPSGITLYDQVTHEPYCLFVANGQTKTVKGRCEDINWEEISTGGASGNDFNGSVENQENNSENDFGDGQIEDSGYEKEGAGISQNQSEKENNNSAKNASSTNESLTQKEGTTENVSSTESVTSTSEGKNSSSEELSEEADSEVGLDGSDTEVKNDSGLSQEVNQVNEDTGQVNKDADQNSQENLTQSEETKENADYQENTPNQENNTDQENSSADKN